MSIKCVIIDDEPLARKGLKEYIADNNRVDAAISQQFRFP